MTHSSDVQDFLKVKDQFQLGILVTESSHPVTMELSQAAQENPEKAIQILQKVDVGALETFITHLPKLKGLQFAIKETIESGGKIFLGGCGATGRLSLVCEFIWRWEKANNSLKDKVISFMAGGDVALISSIEKFEDFPDYGARQLLELGFGENDLFIGSTEGGETPFVIGATFQATKTSKRKPWFLYCNPDHILAEKIQRSREVITSHLVEKINLTVGPMSITGSTRMQASTVLMYTIGICLELHNEKFEKIQNRVLEFVKFYQELDISCLSEFIKAEADQYQNDGLVYYEPSQEYAIAVLTDTTERSPTFSLSPFENELDLDKKPSLCYLVLPNETESKNAWKTILLREPRVLNWPEITNRTTAERLWGFDLSRNVIDKRAHWHKKESVIFKIQSKKDSITFELNSLRASFDFEKISFLERHLALKMILNSLSTAIMGRLGRYDGNVMTWVRSSNFKLIDRTIRYVTMILQRDGVRVDYDKVARLIFQIKDNFPSDKPLVLELVKQLKTETNHSH